jgi:hypothetical protein
MVRGLQRGRTAAVAGALGLAAALLAASAAPTEAHRVERGTGPGFRGLVVRVDSGPLHGSTTRPDVTFRFSALGGRGAKRFACRVDRGRARRCTSPLRLAGLRRGRHEVVIAARDRRGNRASTRRVWRVGSRPAPPPRDRPHSGPTHVPAGTPGRLVGRVRRPRPPETLLERARRLPETVLAGCTLRFPVGTCRAAAERLGDDEGYGSRVRRDTADEIESACQTAAEDRPEVRELLDKVCETVGDVCLPANPFADEDGDGLLNEVEVMLLLASVTGTDADPNSDAGAPYDPCNSDTDGDELLDGGDLVLCKDCGAGVHVEVLVKRVMQVGCCGEHSLDDPWMNGDPWLSGDTFLGTGNIAHDATSDQGAAVKFDTLTLNQNNVGHVEDDPDRTGAWPMTSVVLTEEIGRWARQAGRNADGSPKFGLREAELTTAPVVSLSGLPLDHDPPPTDPGNPVGSLLSCFNEVYAELEPDFNGYCGDPTQVTLPEFDTLDVFWLLVSPPDVWNVVDLYTTTQGRLPFACPAVYGLSICFEFYVRDGKLRSLDGCVVRAVTAGWLGHAGWTFADLDVLGLRYLSCAVA